MIRKRYCDDNETHVDTVCISLDIDHATGEQVITIRQDDDPWESESYIRLSALDSVIAAIRKLIE